MASFFALHGVAGISGTSHVRLTARAFAATAALAAVLVCSSLRPADAGTLVNFTTQLGTVQIDLFDDLVSETVTNFLSYANSGAYDNTVVHRADVSLGVIQGGGYTLNTQTGQFVHIPTGAGTILQYNRANTRGTIAMARTANLNSATSEWFINTKDNSTVLGPNNGGGYTVFGWVVGNGMTTVDSILALPKASFNGTINGAPVTLANFPVQNYTSGQVQPSNVINHTVTVVGTHPDYQNPVMNADVVNDGLIRVSDAHAVINDLLANGSRTITGPFTGTNYLDVNGSGTISVADAHNVINTLLADAADAQAAPLALPSSALLMDAFDSPGAVPMFTAVPEPTSLSLAALAAISLACGAIWRRRRLAARPQG